MATHKPVGAITNIRSPPHHPHPASRSSSSVYTVYTFREQFLHAGFVDGGDGVSRRRSDELFNIGAIDESEIDGAGQVGGGENKDVGMSFDAIDLRQEGVDDPDGVAGFVAVGRRLTSRRQTFYLVDEKKDERFGIL